MDTFIARFGILSGATWKTYLRLSVKLLAILSLGAAAYTWSYMNLHQTLFEAFYGCDRFVQPDQAAQCISDLHRRTQWISFAVMLLIGSLTLYVVARLCHQFSKTQCWDIYEGKASEGKVTQVLMKIFGVTSMINGMLVLITTVP